MSQDNIKYMLEKILHFETYEDRLTVLEMKNEELEAYLIIMRNQLENLTQKNNNLIGETADSGSNFAEKNPFEDEEILPNQDTDTDPGQFYNQQPCTDGAGDIPIHIEMETVYNNNGSHDGNIENQESFTFVEIKSEGSEWNCGSNMIEENVEIFPASTSNPQKQSQTQIVPSISISSEREFQFYKSNLNLFSKYDQNVPKILQNVVIPLIRVDSVPNVSQHSIIHTKKDKVKFKRTANAKPSQNFHSKSWEIFVPKSSQTFECGICSKKFPSMQLLYTHLRIHTGEKRYPCSKCPRKFTQTGNLARHMKVHEKLYRCQFCPKFFYNEEKLVTHSRTHGDNNKTHINIEESPLPLSVSSFEYPKKINNKKIHKAGEKPSCPECFKKFSHKTSLVRHMRIHTGEKPFGCQFCPRFFRFQESLVIHRRTHTGERPYECPGCHRKFVCKGNLDAHFKSYPTHKKS